MPSLAMLCQNQVDDAITAETLREQLLKDWKELEPDLLTVSADNGDDVVALDYGEAYIAVMNIPAPIGDDTVELVGPSRLWPETEAFNGDYQAHAVVTVTGFGEDLTGLDDTFLLSKVVTSLVAISPETFAVYWGSANHLIYPPLFREITMEALPNPLLLLWVAINVGERPDGVMTGHTVGLDAVGLMDIEIPQTPKTAEETVAFLVDVADYLLTNGLVIKDGDAVKETDEETIRAVYAVSLLDPEKTVIQLQSDMPYSEVIEPPKRGFLARLFGK